MLKEEQNSFRRGKDAAYKTKYLATLVKDAYIPYKIEELNYRNYEHPKLYRFYKKWNLIV